MARQHDSNTLLRLASIFHSLDAIAGAGLKFSMTMNSKDKTSNNNATQAIVPKPNGIKHMQTSSFQVGCLSTLTNMKFVIFTINEFSVNEMEILLTKIYECYFEYVLKNPFYEIEMPIRVQLFDEQLQLIVNGINR